MENLSGFSWFLVSVIVNLCLIIVSMIAYWLTQWTEFAKKQDVLNMIQQAHQLTDNELKHLIAGRNEMTVALKENTDAIQHLRIEFAEFRRGR
jgi:hypothetical protein